ncbi:MAG: phosphonate C-P lyase system protein PhnH [Pseudomonadota bacterium]
MTEAIASGFQDPSLGAQQTFRAVLKAMSEPARPVTIDGPEPPAPLLASTWALALTLFDHNTPLWIDAGHQNDATLASLRFHCGCPIVDAVSDGSFAIVAEPSLMPPLDSFNQGSLAYPDRAATIIIQGVSLNSGTAYSFRGPGIDNMVDLSLDGLSAEFWQSWEVNRVNFPSGVDVILASGQTLVGLPRTVECRERDCR